MIKTVIVSKERELSKKIVAIGDLHGDLKSTVKTLTMSNLIDASRNWIGKNTILIQMGDILDRGGRDNTYGDENSEVTIINLFYKLKQQAKKKGGDVICLIGNHEMLNFQGVFDYCTKKSIRSFGSEKKRELFYKPGNKMCRHMNKLFKAIYKIGPWVFVHGGIRPYLSNKYTILQINNIMSHYLNGNAELESTKQFEELFSDDKSILWYREFSYEKVNCKQLTQSLYNLKAKYMVVGHTPQDNINSKCKNRIWRIDTAMSEAFGKRTNDGRISCMEITNGGRKVNIYHSN